MPCCTSAEPGWNWLATLRRLATALLFGGSLLGALPADADDIAIRHAELVLRDEGYVLDADFDLTLNPTLEEALHKGVSLYFSLEFELVRPRSFWFGETVAQRQESIRLLYNPLTRQYQLSYGLIRKSFDNLEDMRYALAHLRDWKVAERGAVKRGVAYRAGVFLKLDTSRLPKPLQLNAITSREWNLESEWHYWTWQT